PADGESAAGEALRRKLWPWRQSGHVDFTDGNTIDLGVIESAIKDAAAKYDLRGVNYDPWNAGATAQALQAGGIAVSPFVQTASRYNEPARVLERALVDGRL